MKNRPLHSSHIPFEATVKRFSLIGVSFLGGFSPIVVNSALPIAPVLLNASRAQLKLELFEVTLNTKI